MVTAKYVLVTECTKDGLKGPGGRLVKGQGKFYIYARLTVRDADPKARPIFPLIVSEDSGDIELACECKK
jgi:hypothetical protein